MCSHGGSSGWRASSSLRSDLALDPTSRLVRPSLFRRPGSVTWSARSNTACLGAPFVVDLLSGREQYIRKESLESLRHRRMCENGVAEPRIWQLCHHGRLYSGQDLAGLGTDHREAANTVVALTDQNLHETLPFVGRLRPQHCAHRQSRDAHGDPLASRVAFAQSHVGEGRVREHAVWNQAVARAALASGQIVPNDPKVVAGYMRELRATGAFPDGPD